jgi:hypothetical protein
VLDQGENEGSSSLAEVTPTTAQAIPAIDQTTLTIQKESVSMDSSTDARKETKQLEYDKISPTLIETTPNSATSMTSVIVCFSDRFC